jgi:uncharacterized protein
VTATFTAILQTLPPDPWWLTALQGIGLFFFFVLMLASLIAIVIGLPGLWVIMAEAIVFALVTDFARGIGWWDLIALLVMAGAAELFEFLITMRGAEKSGGSRAAGWWAIVGGILGAMAFNWVVPVLGALVGAFIGVFVGAFLSAYYQENDFEKAMKVGAGAFRGRMGAVLVKEAFGVAMAAMIVWHVVKG